MSFKEQISVYLYQPALDGFGEYLPAAPVLQTQAPQWCSIENLSGDDLFIGERNATQARFQLVTNYGFTFSRNMFIVTRFGNMDIIGIRESRFKRFTELQCAFIEGVDDTGSGDATTVGGLYTVYYTVATEGATVTVPQIIGKQPKLLFRDGIEKKIVDANPQINEVMINGGVLSLVTDDIFGNGERITILYAT